MSKLLVDLSKIPKTAILRRQMHNNEPPNCPPCPKPEKPQPEMVRAKTCEPCSFLKMKQDVCDGIYKPKSYTPSKWKVWTHKCKPTPVCNLCHPPKAKCNELNLNQCKEIPDCPKPNWDCKKGG